MSERAGYFRSAGAGIALALLIGSLFFSPTSPFQNAQRGGIEQYVSLGEALIHGVDSQEGSISARMPLASVQAAVLFGHGSETRGRAAQALPLLIVPLLVFGLGALTGSIQSAVVAASIFNLLSLTDGDGFLWTYPQSYYTIYFLLTACILVWRSRRPTITRSLLLGATVGLGLLFRSPLSFFPFLLLLWDLGLDYRQDGRAGRTGAFLAAAVPFLFLLPIIRTNGILHGQYFAFEWGPPDNNIITGAWGLVPTVAGDWRLFVDNPPQLLKYGDAMDWALKRIAEHPLVYLRSCVLRVGYVISLKPVLWTAAAVSVWLGRRERTTRLLALLIGYYTAVHCAMSVRSEYFVPLWPILAVLAASAPARFIGKRAEAYLRIDPLTERRTIAGVSALFGCAMLLGLVSLRLSYAYGSLARLRPPESAEALKRAVDIVSADAWLRAKHGRALMAGGEWRGAAQEFKEALLRRPHNEEWRLDYAWAQMRAGRFGPIMNYRARGAENGVKAHIARYVAFKRLDQSKDARRALEDARRTSREDLIVVHRVKTSLEKFADAKGRAGGDTNFLNELSGCCDRLLTGAEKLMLYSDMGDPAPLDVGRLIDQAQAEKKSGDRESAAAFLDLAEGLPADKEAIRRAAFLNMEIGRMKKALLLSDKAVGLYEQDAEIWIDRADILGAAGDLPGAQAGLARAFSLAPDDEELLHIALLYQKWKNYGRAIEILKPLAVRPQTASRALKDMGMCEYFRGNTEAAVKNLEEALSIDSGLYSAALTLGAVYASMGQSESELHVYERALKSVPRKEEREMRDALLKNRSRLKSVEGSSPI
jgi:tetratricopeptide (TPR) repeat protein